MTDATDETLRATVFREAGRVVVARFFGLTVGKIEIGENEGAIQKSAPPRTCR